MDLIATGKASVKRAKNQNTINPSHHSRSFFLKVKNPALTGGALKTFKTISTVCHVHDADT
jgi:hypothetical protein